MEVTKGCDRFWEITQDYGCSRKVGRLREVSARYGVTFEAKLAASWTLGMLKNLSWTPGRFLNRISMKKIAAKKVATEGYDIRYRPNLLVAT